MIEKPELLNKHPAGSVPGADSPAGDTPAGVSIPRTWEVVETKTGLGLLCLEGNPSKTPFCIDFTSVQTTCRRLQAGWELLHRAFGIHKGKRPLVVDCTGGLGRDAFLLAASGCQVMLFERHPLLAALLKDALLRAEVRAETAAIVKHIAFCAGDSREFLRQTASLGSQLQSVYLDPMFPARRKSAKVKKEAQILQMLTDSNPGEEAELLELARCCAQRTVVKRPAGAPLLDGQQPSFSLRGKTVRFDVYL